MKYLIAYAFRSKDGTSGYGRTFMETHHGQVINKEVHIIEIEHTIARENDWPINSVAVTSFQKLAG